ncbi:hypothetical protein Gpo141_00008100 [Globisporangium polare]
MWYPGRIQRVHSSDDTDNASYEVVYDDGEIETHVLPQFLRFHVSGTLSVGTRVFGRYAGGDEWYPGKVTEVQENGCYTIEYDDSEVETDVPLEFIKEPTEASFEPTAGDSNEQEAEAVAVGTPDKVAMVSVDDEPVDATAPEVAVLDMVEPTQAVDSTPASHKDAEEVSSPQSVDGSATSMSEPQQRVVTIPHQQQQQQPVEVERPRFHAKPKPIDSDSAPSSSQPHHQQQSQSESTGQHQFETDEYASIVESIELLGKRLGDAASIKAVLSTLVKQMRTFPQVTADLVHSRNGEKLVIDVLKFHDSHAVIQCYCFVLLRRLCFLCAKSTHFFLRNEIIDFVTGAMRRFAEDAILQASACGALAVFTRVHAGLNLLLEHRVAQLVLATIVYHKTYSIHTRQVHYYACEVLLELCELGDRTTLDALCGDQVDAGLSDVSPISLLLFLLRQGLSFDDKKACCAVGTLLMCLAANNRYAAGLILRLNGLPELSTVMAKYPSEPGIHKYSACASKEIALSSIQKPSPARRVKDTASEILQESGSLEELHHERFQQQANVRANNSSSSRPMVGGGRSRTPGAGTGKRKTAPVATAYPSPTRGQSVLSYKDPLSFSKFASPIGKAPYLPSNMTSFASNSAQQRNSLAILDGNAPHGSEQLFASSSQASERKQFVKEERQSLLFETYGVQGGGIVRENPGTTTRGQGIKRKQLKTHLVSAAESTWATSVVSPKKLMRDDMLSNPGSYSSGQPFSSRPDVLGMGSYASGSQRSDDDGGMDEPMMDDHQYYHQQQPTYRSSELSPTSGRSSQQQQQQQQQQTVAKKKKKKKGTSSSSANRESFQIKIESETQLRISKELRSPFASPISPSHKRSKATISSSKTGGVRASAAHRSSSHGVQRSNTVKRPQLRQDSESLNAYAAKLFNEDFGCLDGDGTNGISSGDFVRNSALSAREQAEIQERERLSFAEKLHKMIDKAKSTLAVSNVTSEPISRSSRSTTSSKSSNGSKLSTSRPPSEVLERPMAPAAKKTREPSLGMTSRKTARETTTAGESSVASTPSEFSTSSEPKTQAVEFKKHTISGSKISSLSAPKRPLAALPAASAKSSNSATAAGSSTVSRTGKPEPGRPVQTPKSASKTKPTVSSSSKSAKPTTPAAPVLPPAAAMEEPRGDPAEAEKSAEVKEETRQDEIAEPPMPEPSIELSSEAEVQISAFKTEISTEQDYLDLVPVSPPQLERHGERPTADENAAVAPLESELAPPLQNASAATTTTSEEDVAIASVNETSREEGSSQVEPPGESTGSVESTGSPPESVQPASPDSETPADAEALAHPESGAENNDVQPSAAAVVEEVNTRVAVESSSDAVPDASPPPPVNEALMDDIYADEYNEFDDDGAGDEAAAAEALDEQIADDADDGHLSGKASLDDLLSMADQLTEAPQPAVAEPELSAGAEGAGAVDAEPPVPSPEDDSQPPEGDGVEQKTLSSSTSEDDLDADEVTAEFGPGSISARLAQDVEGAREQAAVVDGGSDVPSPTEIDETKDSEHAARGTVAVASSEIENEPVPVSTETVADEAEVVDERPVSRGADSYAEDGFDFKPEGGGDEATNDAAATELPAEDATPVEDSVGQKDAEMSESDVEAPVAVSDAVGSTELPQESATDEADAGVNLEGDRSVNADDHQDAVKKAVLVADVEAASTESGESEGADAVSEAVLAPAGDEIEPPSASEEAGNVAAEAERTEEPTSAGVTDSQNAEDAAAPGNSTGVAAEPTEEAQVAGEDAPVTEVEAAGDADEYGEEYGDADFEEAVESGAQDDTGDASAPPDAGTEGADSTGGETAEQQEGTSLALACDATGNAAAADTEPGEVPEILIITSGAQVGDISDEPSGSAALAPSEEAPPESVSEGDEQLPAEPVPVDEISLEQTDEVVQVSEAATSGKAGPLVDVDEPTVASAVDVANDDAQAVEAVPANGDRESVAESFSESKQNAETGGDDAAGVSDTPVDVKAEDTEVAMGAVEAKHGDADKYSEIYGDESEFMDEEDSTQTSKPIARAVAELPVYTEVSAPSETEKTAQQQPAGSLARESSLESNVAVSEGPIVPGDSSPAEETNGDNDESESTMQPAVTPSEQLDAEQTDGRDDQAPSPQEDESPIEPEPLGAEKEEVQAEDVQVSGDAQVTNAEEAADSLVDEPAYEDECSGDAAADLAGEEAPSVAPLEVESGDHIVLSAELNADNDGERNDAVDSMPAPSAGGESGTQGGDDLVEGQDSVTEAASEPESSQFTAEDALSDVADLPPADSTGSVVVSDGAEEELKLESPAIEAADSSEAEPTGSPDEPDSASVAPEEEVQEPADADEGYEDYGEFEEGEASQEQQSEADAPQAGEPEATAEPESSSISGTPEPEMDANPEEISGVGAASSPEKVAELDDATSAADSLESAAIGGEVAGLQEAAEETISADDDQQEKSESAPDECVATAGAGGEMDESAAVEAPSPTAALEDENAIAASEEHEKDAATDEAADNSEEEANRPADDATAAPAETETSRDNANAHGNGEEANPAVESPADDSAGPDTPALLSAEHDADESASIETLAAADEGASVGVEDVPQEEAFVAEQQLSIDSETQQSSPEFASHDDFGVPGDQETPPSPSVSEPTPSVETDDTVENDAATTAESSPQVVDDEPEATEGVAQESGSPVTSEDAGDEVEKTKELDDDDELPAPNEPEATSPQSVEAALTNADRDSDAQDEEPSTETPASADADATEDQSVSEPVEETVEVEPETLNSDGAVSEVEQASSEESPSGVDYSEVTDSEPQAQPSESDTRGDDADGAAHEQQQQLEAGTAPEPCELTPEEKEAAIDEAASEDGGRVHADSVPESERAELEAAQPGEVDAASEPKVTLAAAEVPTDEPSPSLPSDETGGEQQPGTGEVESLKADEYDDFEVEAEAVVTEIAPAVEDSPSAPDSADAYDDFEAETEPVVIQVQPSIDIITPAMGSESPSSDLYDDFEGNDGDEASPVAASPLSEAPEEKTAESSEKPAAATSTEDETDEYAEEAEYNDFEEDDEKPSPPAAEPVAATIESPVVLSTESSPREVEEDDDDVVEPSRAKKEDPKGSDEPPADCDDADYPVEEEEFESDEKPSATASTPSPPKPAVPAVTPTIPAAAPDEKPAAQEDEAENEYDADYDAEYDDFED